LKDPLNFLLVVFILTGLNYNLISCPKFGEYYIVGFVNNLEKIKTDEFINTAIIKPFVIVVFFIVINIYFFTL
jgi:hypothetical protein